jgi:predicted DCC family thiol-disulfide oxidoreductase YuxK
LSLVTDLQTRPARPPPRRGPQLTVLYDADCGVCRHTARTLRALDARGRLRFAPLQGFTPASDADPDLDQLLARLHVRDAEGRWSSGGGAMLRIAEMIPLLFPLAVIARLPGAERVTEAAYEVVARNRRALSGWLRLDACRFDPERPRT